MMKKTSARPPTNKLDVVLRDALQSELDAGRSIREVATAADIHHASLLRWIRGETDIKGASVLRLAHTLGLQLVAAKRR